MNYYDDTVSYGETFEERIGAPEQFDASLGKIIEGFSFLERTLSNVIILLLGVTNEIGDIITAELSYKNKLNLLSSLFQYKLTEYKKAHSDVETQFKELLSLCNKAEGLRNQIIHSNYVANQFRVKITAKAKKGTIAKIRKMTVLILYAHLYGYYFEYRLILEHKYYYFGNVN